MWDGKCFAIGVKNELTLTTAFQFFHFLKHLDEACFFDASVECATSMLNPAVFKFTTVENLRPVKLHCKRQPHHLPRQPGEGEMQASVEERRAPASKLLNLDTLFEFH